MNSYKTRHINENTKVDIDSLGKEKAHILTWNEAKWSMKRGIFGYQNETKIQHSSTHNQKEENSSTIFGI